MHTCHSRNQGNRLMGPSSLKSTFLVLAFAAVAMINLHAQTFTTLVHFDVTNGAYPFYGSLVQSSNGNFYGTTSEGGTYVGTIFEVTPGGTLTTVYNFCSQTNCADGIFPESGITFSSDGNLYGVTNQGGANQAGTIFQLGATGVLTVLHSFCSQTNCTDGGFPYAGLTYYGGALYGTTSSGGANGNGNIFEITTSGEFTILHNFCSKANCTDGAGVYNPLVSADGKLYGVTAYGGANGWGTVFDMTTGGVLKTLHSFANTDGSIPIGGLVQASDGNLYGTTSVGGPTDNGTLFKITKTGKLTTLYNFCSLTYCADGNAPYGTLIEGSSGDLYGTTAVGGANNRGTVFQITTNGALTTLHSFQGNDGFQPLAGLVQGSNGNLYGTTPYGGGGTCSLPPCGSGTIFSLTP
jgi:uncharacterized repeat protein (TIGR03803 family)